MSKKKYLILFLLSCSLLLCSWGIADAQPHLKQVHGYVLDTAGVSLKGVSVRLTSSSDTLFMVSTAAGYYSFKDVKGTDIRISYSMLGYKIYAKTLINAERKSRILIADVKMEPQKTLIDDILVVKTIPVVYSQDTIQYNMDAFKFRAGSLLEEALKQLPGVQVARDGTVYAYGKAISSVQVDGKKFFGGDVLTATRNLPADFIRKVQVINYYGDYATDKGMRNEEPEKILNIVLKEDRKRISFGQVTAGGGTQDRYLGSIGLNRFNDGQEFSVLGSINNTNTSLFSFGSPSGAGEREKSLLDVMDFVDPTDGLNNVKSLGISFADNLTDQTQFSTNYSYTRKQNVTRGNSILRSTYVGNTISNEENYQRNNDDHFHKVATEFKHRFKNNDMLEIRPILSYNRVFTGNSKKRLISNNRVFTFGTYRDTALTESPNLDVDLIYAKAFKKAGRKLLGSFVVNFNSQDKVEDVNDSYLLIDSSFVNPRRTNVAQELFVQQNNSSNGVKASVSYIEPFTTTGLLEVLYDYEMTNMYTQRRVEDKLKTTDIKHPYYVDSLGVHYNYSFNSSRVGLNYQYTPHKKFRANIGFAVQPITLSGTLRSDDQVYEYTNVNLVPTTGFKWRLNAETDWSVDYVGKNNQPNFLHIIPVTDNTNLQNIIIGNPNLKAEFSNRISTMFRKFITSRGQYFETNLAYNFVANKIVSDKTALFNSTIQQTTFRNTDGYYDMKWYFLFNTPLFSDNVQLDVVGNADYYNNLAYVNEKRNTTKQFVYSQSLQLRYSWSDYFESVFNGNYVMNKAQYTWPFTNTINAQSILLGAATKGYLSDYVTLGAEMSQRFNVGYESSFMNNNPTTINAYLEISFLPNKLALIRVQGYDLLNQNKNMGTYSEYIGNDLYEARNNRLGRYFMLSLNVRLQKYPKK